MSSFRIIEFSGYKICVNNETYEPAEDTELMLSIITIKDGERVLEVGSGSGVLSVHAARLGGKVVAIDINPFAAEATLCSAKLNRVNDRISIVNCDMITCLRHYVFDIAIFNPPYLPYEEFDSWLSYSWSGGKTGIEQIIRFLDAVTARRFYILYSSLSDELSLLEYIKRKGFRISRKVEKIYGYESLIALELYAKSDFS